jgi:hypothetical protein
MSRIRDHGPHLGSKVSSFRRTTPAPILAQDFPPTNYGLWPGGALGPCGVLKRRIASTVTPLPEKFWLQCGLLVAVALGLSTITSVTHASSVLSFFDNFLSDMKISGFFQLEIRLVAPTATYETGTTRFRMTGRRERAGFLVAALL